MKNLFFITLIIVCLCGCGQKRPAVIERPVFEVWNSTTLEIDKIEMNDSVTIFYIDAYFYPNQWIRIAGDTYIRESGSDEKLPVSHSEGINLDEETYMPESGTISFKLFFPPLKPEITKLDFIESDCPDCFKIYGIELLPDAKIKIEPLPKVTGKTLSTALPAPVFSEQKTNVSGKIIGYVKGITSDIVTIYTTNIIDGEQVVTELAVADDGTFNGDISPGLAGLYNSSAGSLFLVPGEDIKIYTDLKKRSRYQSRYRTDKQADDSVNTVISGRFTSEELEAINQARNSMFDFQKLMKEVVNMKPEEFKQHILGIMNSKIDEIKDYSPNTGMLIINNIKLRAYTLLMQYESFINSAYMRENNITTREEREKVTFKAEKPDENYYSFLNGALSDDMSYLPSYLFMTELLASNVDVHIFELPDGKDKPVKERFAYFKEKFTSVTGIDKGIIFDLIQAQLYGKQISDMKFFTDAEQQEINDAFKDNPAIAERLISENEKMVVLIAANKANTESVAHETPEVSMEKMFDAIVANYRGKVVVVDFWATWCGPCMNAMKAIKPLKEEMTGKDVVWLYLTGETSPLSAWMKTYPTISGEHYRVSEAQWRFWYKTYGIEGIPTYMIFDRNGKQLAKYTGFPGVEQMKEDIGN